VSGNRVVISGLGLVSALGHELDEFWAACLAGRSRVESIPTAWSHYYKSKSRTWSPLSDPDYSHYGLTRADLLRYDRAVLNAIVAADDAIAQAGFDKIIRDERARSFYLEGVDSDRCGVFIGTGLGCISSAFNNYVPHLLGTKSSALFATGEFDGEERHLAELRVNLKQHPRVNPFASCQSMANAIGASLSIRYGSRGPTETLVYACAAGTAAIARAFRAIQYGEIDIAIAGGSEYYGDRAGGVFMAFDRLQTLVAASEPLDAGNRPFDEDRSGFLFSQGGAGIVVLESEQHARKRGASPLAAIRGMSITSDAHSLVAISEDDNAIELMFKRLLRDSALEAADISYVNAHGTSTAQNDAIEAKILERMFPNGPFINSTKSLLGHTIGASGAIECIVTVLSMRSGKIHPSRNLRNPVCDLNFAIGVCESQIDFAVTHSFGFGGHNVGLILQNIAV
jgi:3-oxoacyl-[acyl-carrier-protein] synthase II